MDEINTTHKLDERKLDEQNGRKTWMDEIG